MKFRVIVALLATSACCALGFEVAAPPKLQGSAVVRKQLEDALALSNLGLSADATASISTGFFNRILADVDSYINAIGTKLVIPGQSEKHFSFSDIHFSQFTIGAMSISTSAPNRIVVNINNVGITVPETGFEVKADKWIHCSGKLSATIEGGNFAITLAMGNDGQGHITTVASVATSYQKLDVRHRFNHALCKVTNDIINLLIGNVDKLIDKVIKEDLPKALGPAMTKSFDVLFTKIPLHFTGTPSIVGQGISVTVDLLAPVSASAVAAVPAIKQSLTDFNHDITVDVPQVSINNIMIAAFSAGKFRYDVKLKQTTAFFKELIPSAYAACPNCELDLVFALGQAPTVTFATNDIDATANKVDVMINAINNASRVIPLFAININNTLDVDNVAMRVLSGGVNNLYFQLNVKTLSITLGASNVGPLPLINVVGGLLSTLIKDIAVPAFNGMFQGFDFPTLFGNAAVTALNGVFEFETNILLPPI